MLATLFSIALSSSIVNGQCISQGDTTIQGPAVIKGGKFFDTVSGEYFPVKGINYYPRPNAGPLIGNNIDFFTAEYRAIWERDIPEFVALGVNTLRLFAVDPSLNHDGFFCALRAAGIRVIVGLSASCKDCSITLEEAPLCYPASLKTRGQFIIAEFSKYDNVLAFSISNEIGLQLIGTPEVNAPCAKKFLRDMRAFIQSCPTMRKIPIGLATADRDREENALYYNCRSDPTDDLESVEWYGINAYQHCDGTAGSVEDLRGFSRLKSDFADFGLSVPVILTEFGCINPSFPTIDGFEAQRDFLQVEALFSESYAEYFAGGCVFEYSNEDRKTPSPWPYRTYFRQGNFGVGYFEPEFCNDVDIPCNYVHFPQFDLMARAYDRVDVGYVPSIDNLVANGSLEVPQCPGQFPPLASFTWNSSKLEDWQCPDPVTVTCPAKCSITSPSPTTPASQPVDASQGSQLQTSKMSSRPVRILSACLSSTLTQTQMPPKSPMATSSPFSPPTDLVVLPPRTCSDHVGCSSLTGNCCPTDTKVLLSCCGAVERTCAKNPICHGLGLNGECCPTSSGAYLDCCAVLPGDCYNTDNAFTSCFVYSASRYKEDLDSMRTTPGPVQDASIGERSQISSFRCIRIVWLLLMGITALLC